MNNTLIETSPENAGKMQASGKFQKGQSGNPNGKAKGTKNRATIAAEQLLQSNLDNIFLIPRTGVSKASICFHALYDMVT
jgi:hypothetical protein